MLSPRHELRGRQARSNALRSYMEEEKKRIFEIRQKESTVALQQSALVFTSSVVVFFGAFLFGLAKGVGVAAGRASIA